MHPPQASARHTPRRVRRHLLRALVLCGLCAPVAADAARSSAPRAVAKGAAKAAPRVSDVAAAPFDLHYGLYVSGQKAGWMRTWLTPGPRPTLSFHLEATVAGMGHEASVALDERRTFDGKDGLLSAITFSQRAQTGTVRVEGRRRGEQFELIVEAGGAKQRQTLRVAETLADDLALVALAREVAAGRRKPSAPLRARHLDPASQTVVEAEMTVQQVGEVRLGGITQPDLCVVTRYPALKVEEVSHVDAQGRMLSTKVGGLFEARLEDEAIAKQPGTVQDVLLGAVVKVPHPLPDVADANALTLVLAGLRAPDDVPDSQRLRRRLVPRGLEVTLRKEVAPTAPYCPPWRRPACPAQALSPQAKASLAPSAYVQSAAPPIVAMARKAVGETRDTFAVVSRLVEAVRGHLKAEYVPAFSNALEAYHSRRGDCTEHAVLFVALARAAGLPARPVVGVAYWPPGGGFGWHAWAEVFVRGQWIQVDPTWDQPIADVTHLKLAEGGPAEQASVVMLLGRLQVVDWQVPTP